MSRFNSILTNIKNTFSRVKTYSSGFIADSGRLPANPLAWNGSNFLTANEVSLYTNRAIAKRADKVGEIEFLLKDKNGKEINNHLIDLLYKPNKVFTGRQFWSLYQKYFDLIGEAYIYIENFTEISSDRDKISSNKIKGLHLLIPDKVKKVYNKKTGLVESYKYRNGDNDVTYKADEIIYIHNADPKSPLNGQSLLKSGINAIQTELQISTYHSRVLANGGKPEGVFKFSGNRPLTKDQLTEVKQQYKQEYAQAVKAGLPLFLSGGADYIRTGLTPDELAFLDAKKMTLEDICILTGVPKSMLGSTNDTKYDNADADRMIFLRETIRPLLVTLTTALDEKLFPKEQDLSFVDPTPENVDQKLKEIENGIKNYYLTINEAREKQGLDPIKGGDEILVPFNLVTLGSDMSIKDEETKAKIVRKEFDHPLRDLDTRRKYWEIQNKRQVVREVKFKKVLKEYFDGQEKRITDYLEPNKTRVFRRKGLIDEAMQIALEVKIGKGLFIPVVTELLKQAGLDAMELVGSSYAFNVTSDIAGWIEKRSDIFLTKINETTFKKLKDQFEESLSLGESRDKLVNRIEDTYKDITKARANTIARTEVHNSMQYGTLQGYKQAGLNIKIWVWSPGVKGGVRDEHLAIDGEERPLDASFSNGLTMPGDPNGPAEQVINCQCVI